MIDKVEMDLRVRALKAHAHVLADSAHAWLALPPRHGCAQFGQIVNLLNGTDLRRPRHDRSKDINHLLDNVLHWLSTRWCTVFFIVTASQRDEPQQRPQHFDKQGRRHGHDKRHACTRSCIRLYSWCTRVYSGRH